MRYIRFFPFFLAASLFAQSKTTVTGTLVTPTGDLLTGECSIQSSGPFTTGSQRVTGTPVVVAFTSGKLSVSLFPTPTNWWYNATCSAPLQMVNGRQVGPYSWGPKYWVVPTSSTPVDISAVEVSSTNPPPWPVGPAGPGLSEPYMATSANSSIGVAFTATGLTQTFLDPGQTPLPNTGNVQTASGTQVFAGGLDNPGAYGNIGANLSMLEIFNGFNSPDNTNKDTLWNQDLVTTFHASGQRFGLDNTTACPGAGDCFPISNMVYYSNTSTAPGDEGVSGTSDQIWQQSYLGRGTAGAVTQSTCAITALAAAVAASSAYNAPQTVAVTGSTSACNVGDWLDIDNGVFGVGHSGNCGTGAAGPTQDACHESVQITAKTSSSISALFHLPHTSGAPVAPSPVVAIPSPAPQSVWGQDAGIVDLSGASYSTGTASCASSTGNGYSVTGVGTSWTTNMVGGDSNFVGWISWPAQNQTNSPFSSANPLVSWYPIQTVNSGTSITLARPCTGYYMSDPTLATAQPYIIRWGGYTSQLLVEQGTSAGAQTEGVSGLVLRSTSGTSAWTAGHTIENIISPNSSLQHGYQIAWTSFGPGEGPDMIRILNNGLGQAYKAIRVVNDPYVDSTTRASYYTGLSFEANTQIGVINLGGRDLAGQALGLTTLPSGPNGFSWMTGDAKAINWSGDSAHDASIIHTGSTGTGFQIANRSVKLHLFSDAAPGTGVTLDASGVTGSRTLTVPDVSGNLCLTVTACGNPGYLTRTIPASVNNEVDIGSFSSGVAGSIVSYQAEININNTSAWYQAKTYSFASPGCLTTNVWQIVAPSTDTGPNGGNDFALESMCDSSVVTHFRLRKVSGTGTGTMNITLSQIGDPTSVFTASTGTSSVTAPTALLPTSAITQTGNKLLLTNASNLAATVDPSNLTANRTLTLPDASGTIALTGTTQPMLGSTVIYRCTVAGTLRVGQLTSVASDCGTAVDTGLRTP
jgi:hypothetical protein